MHCFEITINRNANAIIIFLFKPNFSSSNIIILNVDVLQASEQERLLSQKAYLPNGSYGSVFELSYQNGCEHWYCNLCECPVMGRVYHHEIGKRHTHNMSAPGAVVATHTIAAEPTMYIAPGEPVPPGFEGEIEKTAQIQVC